MVIRSSSRPPARRFTSATTAMTFSAVRSPGTTLRIRRLSASNATWSQVSPSRASVGSVGSRCASFLATKAHFSSNGTSRVRGGKPDPLVVEVAGRLAGQAAQAADRAAVDLAEPAGPSRRRRPRRRAPGPIRPGRAAAGSRTAASPGVRRNGALRLRQRSMRRVVPGPERLVTVRFPAPRRPDSGQSEFRQRNRERSSMVGGSGCHPQGTVRVGVAPKREACQVPQCHTVRPRGTNFKIGKIP